MAERDGFERFHAAVRPRLWAWLRRVAGDGALADEVAQEAFVRFLDRDGLALPEAERRPYLYGIAWRVLADLRRHARRHSPLAEAPAETTAPASPEAARAVEVLAALPERQRALLWLAHVEGLSHKEIAAALGLSPGSVRVLLHRARARAAALLGGEDPP
ncbi:MAG: sigma-70 family RNA polymerase sigma factor [Anaeromyxobacteraceae bacterium]